MTLIIHINWILYLYFNYISYNIDLSRQEYIDHHLYDKHGFVLKKVQMPLLCQQIENISDLR